MKSEKKYYNTMAGNPGELGAKKTGQGYHFGVAVPDGAEASLLLYRKGSSVVEQEIPLPAEERTGNISAVLIKDLPRGEWEYNYCIDGKIVQDPYATRIVGREVFGKEPESVRCAFARKPPIVKNTLEIPYEDAIFYKTHVRGFTMQRGSRVRKKGTFAGVMEKIPYLQELGVTSLELMPVYEFDELPPKRRNNLPFVQTDSEKINYWGYGDACYFAPKASYAAGKDPVGEFAQLVDALHFAGIECILEFYFPVKITAGYILEVLHYWKLTFGVDGFHLIGDGVPFEMIAKDPLLTRTKLIFTGFDLSRIYPDGTVPCCRNLADCHLGFQETMRRFLKGDSGMLESFTYYTRKNDRRFGTIQFVANNDGFTLADTVSYNEKHNEENGESNHDGSNANFSWNCGVEGPSRKAAVKRLRMQQMKNAFLMMLLSQGTPMIYGGDEFGNSQGGNNNAYCQDNETGWINWSGQKNYRELTEFVKKAIAFRKSHPILHMAAPMKENDYLAYGMPDLSYHGNTAWFASMDESERSIGILYCGNYAIDEKKTHDNLIYVAYNMHWTEKELALPKLPAGNRWYLVADTGTQEVFCPDGEETMLENKKNLSIPPRTILILVGKQEVKENECMEAL